MQSRPRSLALALTTLVAGGALWAGAAWAGGDGGSPPSGAVTPTVERADDPAPKDRDCPRGGDVERADTPGADADV